jgi:putative ABC transport system ATP-binding protein
MTNIIECINVSKFYFSDDIKTLALQNINFTVKEGEIIAITGPSGSGKTTLINILSLLDRPSSGEVQFLGNKLSSLNDKSLTTLRRKYIGFVFQNPNLIEELDVFQNIEIPLLLQEEKFTFNQRREQILEILETLNIKHLASTYPIQLSGGELQRVAIARGFVHNPKILVLDEPTGSLNEENAKLIMEYLLQIQKISFTTIIFVTHNLEITKFSERVVKLTDGKIV